MCSRVKRLLPLRYFVNLLQLSACISLLLGFCHELTISGANNSTSADFCNPVSCCQHAYSWTCGQLLAPELIIGAELQIGVPRLSLQPKAWFPNANTSASLTKLHPLNSANVITLNISTHAAVGGIINTGYWGIPVQKGKSYFFSAHFADPFAEFKV